MSPSRCNSFLFCALCFIMLWPAAARADESVKHINILSTTQLRIVDDHGKPRAALMMDKDNPVLAFLDKNGGTRAIFALRNENPVFAMKSQDKLVKLYMSVGKNGNPMIIFGEHKSRSLSIVMFEDDGPQIYFMDENRMPRICLGVFDGDKPSIGFWQKDKKVRMAMGLDKDQEPLLWLADRTGRPDLSLGRHEDKPQINMTRGNNAVGLGMVQGDAPFIYVKHAGKVVWKATDTVVPDVAIPDELMRFERPKKSWQEQ